MRITIIVLLVLAVLIMSTATIFLVMAMRTLDAPPPEPVGGWAGTAPGPIPDLAPAPPPADAPSGPGAPGEVPAETEPAAGDADEEEAADSKPVSVRKLLESTEVDINYEGEPLLNVLIATAAEAGVPLVVPKDLRKELSEGDEMLVTLRADDISLANVLELIFLVKGSKHEWHEKDGKMHIRRVQ